MANYHYESFFGNSKDGFVINYKTQEISEGFRMVVKGLNTLNETLAYKAKKIFIQII